MLFCVTAGSSTFVQFIAMENGHRNAKGVHHNSYSSVTVVGQLWESTCDWEIPRRLKNKVHCFGKKKEDNQRGSRHNWFGWHDACCNLLSCIEAESQ